MKDIEGNTLTCAFEERHDQLAGCHRPCSSIYIRVRASSTIKYQMKFYIHIYINPN